MSTFKERLEALKGQQGAELFVGEKAEEGRQESIKRTAKEINRIAQFAERFRPMLNLVNSAYLEGEGRIELEKPSPWEVARRLGRPKVSLVLSWGEYNMTDGPSHWRGGYKLLLTFDSNDGVEIQGVGQDSPEEKIKIDITDKDWLNKFEDGVYAVLNKPRACFWEHFYQDGEPPREITY